MIKFFRYGLNLINSFYFDARFFLMTGIKQRCLANTYAEYFYRRNYPGYLKEGAAVKAVQYLALSYCRGEGVDVGAGVWALPGARPIENYETENAYLINVTDESLDYVFSSHLLEHLDQHEAALEEWNRVLVDGGILFLYLPHPVCRMWAPEVLKEHVWMPDPIYLRDLLPKLGFEILEMSFIPDAMMSYHIISKKSKC